MSDGLPILDENSARTPPTGRPAKMRPFRLRRYFSIVSLIGISIVVALLYTLASRSAMHALLDHAGSENEVIARTMVNAFWPRYSPLLKRVPKLTRDELVNQIENTNLRNEVYQLTHQLNVAKIRIYSLSGMTLFSNWDAEIGVTHAAHPSLQAAIDGQTPSVLAFMPRFESFDGTVRDRHLVQTFVAVDHPGTGKREAVIEIFTDVSAEITETQHEQLRIIGVIALCMLALFVFLILAARRAELIMTRQQRELMESERHSRLLASVVEQSHDSIVTRDLDGVVTTWNRGAERIFGFAKHEAIGRSTRELHLSHLSDAEWAEWLASLRAGRDSNRQGWRTTQGGERVHTVVTRSPLRDESGALIGDIAIAHDTTELQRAQEELSVAKDAAEAAVRAKGEFLANMSHEIRTPMNGIIGMTDLALDTHLTAEQREYLEIVKSSSGALLQIINDILDISKIEAGKLTTETVPFGLRESLRQAIKILALRAHEKHLELIWSVDADVPDALVGDALRMRQIILNLTGNAIKFTARGEIEIKVALVGRDAHEAWLHFSVRDTGIGIPADQLNSVFEAFTQADSSVTRRFGGTGLGLSICRRLVELMGGQISVESEPGAGSTFHFTLRQGIGVAAAPPPGMAPSDAFDNQPVLVVDDNARCRNLLCEYLRAWRLAPVGCESGAEALAQLATARAAGRPFRLALIDGTLGEDDSFALATEIASAHAQNTPAIVLADTTQGRAAARARERGYAQVLLKPASQSDLFDAVATALDPHAQHAAVADTARIAAVAPSARLKILLVEDNAVNRTLAMRLLAKLGHTVDEAHDGAAAVRMTAESVYDAVLMDMQMPVMDGLAATRAIRARETGGAHLPIVAMTANAMRGDRERCLDAGMDDYVTKPISINTLLDALALVTTGCAPAPAALAAPAPAAATGEHAPYDRGEALERAAGDEELLAQIIDIYIAETPALLAAIARALESGDGERAFRSAHTLKGSSANLSATGVSAAARTVELAARGGGLAAARDALPALQQAVADLMAALTRERAGAPQPVAAGACA
jgi:two-component system sensor histidine kinase/response regulator